MRTFQDNEKLLPTILTTSYKLSTGVDARNVRNIVLMRPIRNIVEFKQIIGRGTRLFDKKYYFTIYDFVGASDMFKDPDWDGDAYCLVCGNWPCTCEKKPKRPAKPCPKCGQTSSSSAALSPSVTCFSTLPPAPPCFLESASFRRRKIILQCANSEAARRRMRQSHHMARLGA